MRLPLALGFCVLAASCRSGSVVSLTSAWDAEPAELALGDVYLGDEATAALRVRSASRARVELTLAVGAPFSVSPALVLEGGGAVEVQVRFRPTAAGDQAAWLLLSDGAEQRSVAVRGRGLEVPQCAASNPCRTAWFDKALGACAEATAPDGTACESACLTGASCFAGNCVGAAKSCDDGDACTLDACDWAGGCTHTDVSALCPPSTNPCERAVCRPASGCGKEPAADGTVCGPTDCTTARVCMAAQCEARPTPEGFTCAPAGLCQDASTCRQQTCVAGAVRHLAERWRYAPAGRYLFYEGTVDEAGTVYFTESSRTDPAGALELVALRRDGTVKYRVGLPGPCRYCAARLMLDPEGDRLFAGRAGQVQARRLSDGALLWSRDTTAGRTLRSPREDGGGVFSTAAFIALAPGVVVEQLTEGYQLHREYSIALDRATGQVAWERDWWGHVYFPGATGTDRLWVTQADCWAPIVQSQVVGNSGSTVGTLARPARPVAFLGDQALLQSNDDFTWASAQGLGATLPVAPLAFSWALATPERTVLASYDGVRELGADGGVRWALGAPSYISTAALLADGGTLVTAYSGDGGAMLHRFDGRGVQTMACPLPGVSNAGTPVLGLHVAHLQFGAEEAIVAFELPGAELAPEGWVTPAGSPNNDRRPR